MITVNPYQKYQQAQFETVDSGRLILFLYDGALKFMEKARKSLENKDNEGVNTNLIRTQEILAELIASLNFEAHEMAENLLRLYDYIHYQLIRTNVKKEIAPLEEAKKIVAFLREAWHEACLIRGSSMEEIGVVNNGRLG